MIGVHGRWQAAFRSAALAVFVTAIAGTSAAALPAPAATSRFPQPTVTAIDTAIASWFAKYKAPGVIVGIWVPGKGTYVAAKGTADRSTGAPMDVNDHMRIGSITKTFTVTVLLQLADRKRLRLDDPVGKYLPYVPNGNHITLQMLANMTAGIFNYTDDDQWEKASDENPHRVWTPRELANAGLSQPPYFAPGTGWHYSNTNTVLLGLVIEHVLRQPIGDIYERFIFSPLGLHNTIWPTSGALPSPYAHGITMLHGKIVDPTHWNPSISATAGQIVSNLADMKVWAKACATGAQISAALQRQRLTWVTLPPMTSAHSYGLGIVYNNGWLGHNGSIPGYTSEAYYLPSQDATIVVLASSDIMADKMTVADALLHALTQIVTPRNVTN